MLYILTKKESQPVYLPLSTELVKIIKDLRGYKLGSNADGNRKLKLMAAKAGINKDVSFHAARHTFGYRCAQQGVPIAICAQLMGHSEVKTTQTYYKVGSQDVIKAMSDIDKRYQEVKEENRLK